MELEAAKMIGAGLAAIALAELEWVSVSYSVTTFQER